MKDPKNIIKFIDEALALQTEEAREAGALGYMARMLVQATMPHSKPEGFHFSRKNGFLTLSMMAMYPDEIGLPYGSIPRMLMAFITTEAVKTNNREIELGDSLSDFMRKLDLVPTGGRWGSITRLKTQMKRLAACAISCKYEGTPNGRGGIRNITPFDSYDWWEPTDNIEQTSLFPNILQLNHAFFSEIISSPIVFRVETLKLLKQSSMAIDIYIWITYRNSYAKKPSNIPWEALQMQFGAGYPFDERGKRDFKRNFLLALKKVALAYPEAVKLKDNGDTLLFVPGQPDVPKKTIII